LSVGEYGNIRFSVYRKGRKERRHDRKENIVFSLCGLCVLPGEPGGLSNKLEKQNIKSLLLFCIN
jgi:hypothetical protein